MNRLGVGDIACDLTAGAAPPVAAHSHSSTGRPLSVSAPSEIIDASRRTDAPAKRHISDKNHELGNKKSRLGDNLSLAQHKIALVDDIKENIVIDDDNDNDAPMDLSLGNHNKTSTTSSNNDSWRATQATFDASLVQQLRDELRNEETKLVLLRKLRNSQLSQQLIGSSSGSVQLPAASGHRPHTTAPSAVRGAAPVTNGVTHSNGVSTHHAAVRADQLRTGYNRLTGQQNNGRPVASPAAPSRQSQQPATRPPFVSSPATTRYQVPHHPVPSHHQPPAPQPSQPPPPRETPPRPMVPELTLAQRQAAAKLAVRRQLEATLLQLPLPKCPPPELNFVPGIGSHADFVALLGLEEAVQCIINAKPSEADASNNGTEGTAAEPVASTSKDAKEGVTVRKDPFQCARCQTDFTTIWKRDKDNPDAIVCEQCATAARKQALKQEHTDRLKAAFLHALQQERELEATGYTSVVIPPSAPVGTSSNSRSRATAAEVSYRGYEWKPMHYSASDSRLLQNAAMSLSVAAAANRARVDMRSQQPATPTQPIVRRS